MSSSENARPEVVAVVPARMASSRFPGKPLVEIRGLPMVEHVRRRAALAGTVDRVVVATCDQSIIDTVRRFGGEAVMTMDTHERCTDRVQEAMETSQADIVVIVQGDEPLLDPGTVDAVVRPLLGDPDLLCTNLVSTLAGEDDLSNPDVVKACCSREGDILYLTRAAVPYPRVPGDCPVYRQTGIMAFRTAFLHAFSALPETPFERVEAIDMMRVLEHGYSIRAVLTQAPTVGVDRESDLEKVEVVLDGSPDQVAILRRITRTTGGDE